VGARYLFGLEPLRAIALIDRDSSLGVDRTASAMMDFGAGRQLTFTVSTQAAHHQRLQIFGTKGRIEIAVPFSPPADREARIYLDDGSVPGGGSARLIELPAADQYQLQGEAFSRAVRGIQPLAHGLEDAVQNMRVLDALRRSETSAAWEPI